MKKRILSIVLVLAVVLSFLPVVAFADGHVAKIGNRTYSSLRNALNDADEGSVIEMMSNDRTSFTENRPALDIEKGVTIKGNGYTIYGVTYYEGLGSMGLRVSGNSDVTISNLKFSGFTGATPEAIANIRPILVYGNYFGTLTLSGVRIENFNNIGVCLFGGNVVMDGCTINGGGQPKVGIKNWDAKLKISNSTINGMGSAGQAASNQSTPFLLCASGKYEIQSGNYGGQYALAAVKAPSLNRMDGKFEVTGGSFNGAILDQSNNNNFALSGGSYTTDVNPYVKEGYEAVEEDGKWIVREKAEDPDLKAASAVMTLIDLIPAQLPKEIMAFIQDAVKKARAAYDALTPVQKALITAEALEILEKAEAAIEEIKAIKTVTVNTAKVNLISLTSACVKAGASPLDVTKIVLGKKVTKISSGVFRFLTKVKTLDVKTKKLTKASVKDSLKGSKVKTINVKVGTAAANKIYVAKYKKIFTKANAGKKVTVK